MSAGKINWVRNPGYSENGELWKGLIDGDEFRPGFFLEGIFQDGIHFSRDEFQQIADPLVHMTF